MYGEKFKIKISIDYYLTYGRRIKSTSKLSLDMIFIRKSILKTYINTA